MYVYFSKSRKMNVPKIRLSSNYVKGSCAERTNLAANFNKQIFSEIYTLYQNRNSVSIRELERTYKKLMPEPVYLTVKKLIKDEFKNYTGATIVYFYNNKVTNYKMALTAKNNKMEISELPTLMHESMHLFNYLLNPKYIKTAEKLRERNLKDTEVDLYTNYYYTNKIYGIDFIDNLLLQRTKYKTKKAIKHLSADDKILVLNSIRESLQSEINAYKETQKYATELRKKNRQHKTYECKGYQKNFMFEKKLDIVNSILYKIIKHERNKNIAKL